jgi:hypothetical protein
MHIHLYSSDHLEPRVDASSDPSSPGSNTFDTLEIKAMTIRPHRRSFSVYLTAAALLATSAVHASDHRLWREQIAAAPPAPLTLAPTGATTDAADWLWRDQVGVPHALPVYVARAAGADEPSAHALWREQHRPVAGKAAEKPLRIVTEPSRR